MAEASLNLTAQHFARLRKFRRYSYGGDGLGLPIKSPEDAYLLEHGLIMRNRHRVGWIISVTGCQALETKESIEAAQRRPHFDLSKRVASWLEREGRLAWLNRSFNVTTRNDLRAVTHLGLTSADCSVDSPFLGPLRYTSRPDVFSVRQAARRAELQPWIFEVKVSRSDFLADLRKPQKRLAYALLAERVFYACPKGLVGAHEVPIGCGLVVETNLGEIEVVSEPQSRKIRHSAHMNKLLR